MTSKHKFLVVSIILLGLVLFVPLTAKAQSDEAEQVLAESANLDSEPEPLDGVQVDEVKKIPSGFGFWWRDIREWTSLALTINPVKKAEKRLEFAEERIGLADYIIQNSTDPKIQEKAQKMLEKANQYMREIEDKKGDLAERIDEKSQKLLRNITKHNLNKERILEKIEDKLPPEKLGEFQRSRETFEKERRDFLNNLQNNPNVSQEVKDKITDVLSRIEGIKRTREEFRTQQKALLEEIKAGNKDAKDQFEKLREERKQNLEQLRKQFKKQRDEIIDRIKEGDTKAVEELKELNQKQQEEAAKIRGTMKQEAGEIREQLKEQRKDAIEELKEFNQKRQEEAAKIRGTIKREAGEIKEGIQQERQKRRQQIQGDRKQLEERKNLGACTQEAKICPGGSSVFRTGPNCEFATCPIIDLDTN